MTHEEARFKLFFLTVPVPDFELLSTAPEWIDSSVTSERLVSFL